MSEPVSVQEAAASLGIVDALVFRRLSATAWAHIGGLGRGRGWAGVVDVSAEEDPLLALVPPEAGDVLAWSSVEASRVLGPYYAVGTAMVRVSDDVLVVLGNEREPLSPRASDEDLRRLAASLERDLVEVAPAKHLGDELEVLHAVRAVTSGTADDLSGTLQHVVDVAVEWLGCEVGMLRDGAGSTVTTSTWDGFPLDPGAAAPVLDGIQAQAAGAALCVQDAGEELLPAGLGRDRGIRSVLAVPIPEPVGGILVVAHTDARPRGFTGLCQRLGHQVAEAAGLVAHTAALREQLRTLADEHYRAARQDPLTGLGNRLAWDEALSKAQERVERGAEVTVLTLDVDGLKVVNDAFGHEAGDALLRRCAESLSELTGDGDIVSRLGGDEFGVLLPLPVHAALDRIRAIRSRLDAGARSGRRRVAASIGFAGAHRGMSVADAVREADASMYADKRARRAGAGLAAASA